MNINAQWIPAASLDGGESYKLRAVTLARIWPVGSRWQMAVKLPLFWNPENHIFDTKEDAMKCVADTVQFWFDYVDA